MTAPELEWSAVAFLDILGYRRLVEADVRDSSVANLQKVLGVVGDTVASFDEDEFDLRMFSDSIVLASGLDPTSAVHLLEEAARLQARLLQQRLLVRGGVAFGRHYADERVVFSEALVRAYECESRIARVPCVVVDHNFVDYLKNHRDLSEVLRARLRDVCVTDRDRITFLGYLRVDDLPDHAGAIADVRGTMNVQDPSQLEKITWLIEYHNHCARTFGRDELELGMPELLELGLTFGELD